jgi:hypothetical protein
MFGTIVTWNAGDCFLERGRPAEKASRPGGRRGRSFLSASIRGTGLRGPCQLLRRFQFFEMPLQLLQAGPASQVEADISNVRLIGVRDGVD